MSEVSCIGAHALTVFWHQTALRKVVKGVGGLSHAEWRSFENERKVGTGRPEEQRCFVDGDLIEQFLDLRWG